MAGRRWVLLLALAAVLAGCGQAGNGAAGIGPGWG
jgi:hypothetical protein